MGVLRVGCSILYFESDGRKIRLITEKKQKNGEIQFEATENTFIVRVILFN